MRGVKWEEMSELDRAWNGIMLKSPARMQNIVKGWIRAGITNNPLARIRNFVAQFDCEESRLKIARIDRIWALAKMDVDNNM